MWRRRTMPPGATGRSRPRKSADLIRGDWRYRGYRGCRQIPRRSTPRPRGRWWRLLRRRHRAGTPSRRLLAPPSLGRLADLGGGRLAGCHLAGGLGRLVSPEDLVLPVPVPRSSPRPATKPMASRGATRRPQLRAIIHSARDHTQCSFRGTVFTFDPGGEMPTTSRCRRLAVASRRACWKAELGAFA